MSSETAEKGFKIPACYLQPAFLICTVLLAAGAISMPVLVRSFGIVLKKEPIACLKSLNYLDEHGLGPYRVINKSKIENEAVLESLGTEEYIQWLIEDPEVPIDSPVRNCVLFITYYDKADRIPHSPEKCYSGSGFQELSSSAINVEIKDGIGDRKIPARYLVFTRKNADFGEGETKFSLIYLFRVNDVYANSFQSARFELNKNVFGKYSYFSKVEWFFTNGGGKRSLMSEPESIEASKKLLSVILPILEKEHWPKIK